MMPVNADITGMQPHPFPRRLQIFLQHDFPLFSQLAAAASDETGKPHSHIRMNAAEKRAVQRQVDDAPRKAVAPVRRGDSVAVDQKNALALQFKDEFAVDLHAERRGEKGTEREVVISAEVADAGAAVHKVSEGAVQREIVPVHIMPVLVPEFEEISDDHN